MLHGDFVFAARGSTGSQRLRTRNLRWRASQQSGFQQSAYEIFEADIFKRVIADRELFARGVNRAGRIKPRRVDAKVDVGHERAEHNDAIAVLDVAPHVVATHRPLINAHVKRMLLADD